jgi:selenocysteine lyase/cysteine desulfurase
MSDQDALRERFEALRRAEFRRVDECGHVYLDYTGSGLYADSQLRRHKEFLASRVLGNPHSENLTSLAATQLVAHARREILDFFGADPEEYMVVFGGNASAALKLVGESFPFESGSVFCLLEDAHNSVNGIRVFAESHGAQVQYLPLDEELRLDPDAVIPDAGEAPSLFSFPGQSNFSGVQHPLALIEKARAKGYSVLLDAAAFVPTSRLDLSKARPDFVAVSFYKMFGFPTGLGALIGLKESMAKLRRPWFAGGTVEFVSVQNSIHQLALGAEGFEDGTPNFLGIAAVPAGLEVLRGAGIDNIHDRVKTLTARLLGILTALRHKDGRPAVDLYGPRTSEARGGTVAFNLVDPEGRTIPYGIVEREASAVNISLRGGCFCNPGAAEVAFGLPAEEALRCFENVPRGSFTLRGFAECLDFEVAVGALRASVGIATNDADLDRLEQFLSGFRDRAFASSEDGRAA